MCVHNTYIHNSQKLEAIQIWINTINGKQSVCILDGLPLSNKKETNY